MRLGGVEGRSRWIILEWASAGRSLDAASLQTRRRRPLIFVASEVSSTETTTGENQRNQIARTLKPKPSEPMARAERTIKRFLSSLGGMASRFETIIVAAVRSNGRNGGLGLEGQNDICGSMVSL